MRSRLGRALLSWQSGLRCHASRRRFLADVFDVFQAQSPLIVETTWPWSSCSRLSRCCRLPVLSMAMKPIVTLPERDGNQVAMWQISQVSESVASKYVHSKPSFVNSAEYKSHTDEATSSRPTLRNYRPCNTLLICSANTSPPNLEPTLQCCKLVRKRCCYTSPDQCQCGSSWAFASTGSAYTRAVKHLDDSALRKE